MTKRISIPNYGTVGYNGTTYYRTRIRDANGKRIAFYSKTREDLYEKVEAAKAQIKARSFSQAHPTVKDYCEKWLFMKSANIRTTTLDEYSSKVRNYIIKPLGGMLMSDVAPDDIKTALVAASKGSESSYRAVVMLVKSIFSSAEDNHIICENPARRISDKGGTPKAERVALSDTQIRQLLDAIYGLPPYVFIMLGLFAGLRREEILGLKWDCVFLDSETPYLSVRRAWHTEHNRPIVLEDLKTKAARRDVPIPACLARCLLDTRSKKQSEFVVSNSEGGPLSYTQYQCLWRYVKIRSTEVRTYSAYVGGQKVKRTVVPILGEKAAHNGRVVYSLDFHVTPHQLRYTYITNLIHASVDPKTVQYLAGHKNSKITMDIYAKVKYNRPEMLSCVVNDALRNIPVASKLLLEEH